MLVEPPGGSPLRRIPPCFDGAPEAERSLFFWFYSAGKRSVVCDVATPDGAALLDRLAAAADVVIDDRAAGRRPRRCARDIRGSSSRRSRRSAGGPLRDWRARTIGRAGDGWRSRT